MLGTANSRSSLVIFSYSRGADIKLISRLLDTILLGRVPADQHQGVRKLPLILRRHPRNNAKKRGLLCASDRPVPTGRKGTEGQYPPQRGYRNSDAC